MPERDADDKARKQARSQKEAERGREEGGKATRQNEEQQMFHDGSLRVRDLQAPVNMAPWMVDSIGGGP